MITGVILAILPDGKSDLVFVNQNAGDTPEETLATAGGGEIQFTATCEEDRDRQVHKWKTQRASGSYSGFSPLS